MPIQIIFQRKLRFIIDINFLSQLLGGLIFSLYDRKLLQALKVFWLSRYYRLKTLPDDCDQIMKQIVATHVGNYSSKLKSKTPETTIFEKRKKILWRRFYFSKIVLLITFIVCETNSFCVLLQQLRAAACKKVCPEVYVLCYKKDPELSCNL